MRKRKAEGRVKLEGKTRRIMWPKGKNGCNNQGRMLDEERVLGGQLNGPIGTIQGGGRAT